MNEGSEEKIQKDRNSQNSRETAMIIAKRSGNIDDCIVNQIPKRRNVTEPASIKFGSKPKVCLNSDNSRREVWVFDLFGVQRAGSSSRQWMGNPCWIYVSHCNLLKFYIIEIHPDSRV